jgi:signal transduction histidine kinase
MDLPAPRPVRTPPPDYAAMEQNLERLENEFTSLKDQLRHAQRLASIGTAAAMLAHECNNLLTPTVGYARYALDRDDKALMTKALHTTIKQSDAITAMCARILGLAMDERQSSQSVNVKSLVANTIGCLGRDLSKDGIALTVDVSDDLCVLGIENQLQQVLFNLILNARDAMADNGGRLTIAANPLENDRLEITVADNGGGIPPDVLENIFEPFFTTKRDPERLDKRGTGLGLAVSKDIIQEQDGTIAVHSAVHQGTTFIITLPAAAPG